MCAWACGHVCGVLMVIYGICVNCKIHVYICLLLFQVSTYALFVEDVLEVASDKVFVHEAAAARLQRLTKVRRNRHESIIMYMLNDGL